MERPEDDAPLADDTGAFPGDMPIEPGETEDGERAATRPDRTEHQEPEPRPDR